MKYKIVAGSSLFDQLTDLFKRLEQCRASTHAIADEFGAKQWLGSSKRPLAGGISGFMLDKMPEGWKRVSAPNLSTFFPKSIPANKALLARISALPIIERDVLNEIVGFKEQWIGLTRYSSPGIKFGYDFHIMEVSEETKYTPIDGMEEITVSEYNRLKAIIEEAESKEVAE